MQKFNMLRVHFRARHGLLAVLLALLAACSSVRLAYNHGETMLYWWLNAYVDLEADQKGWVRQDIDNLFAWHRKTQLHDYAQLLATGQRQLQGNLTQADLLADYSDIKARTQLLLFKALPELADLARTLRPEQVAQLEKKFASNNDDFRKHYLSGDAGKRQKYRFEKALDQFELWFGGFSREQEDLIRKASDARPLDNEIWLDERIRRQRNIVSLVHKVQRDKLGKDATMALIGDLIRDSFARLEHSERKAFFDAYTEGTAQMVLTVVRIATPAQKAHALRRMQGWIDDFNILAADAR